MTAFKNLALTFAVGLAIVTFAGAEAKQAGDADWAHKGFEKIKALSGEWEVAAGPGSHDHGPMAGTVSYKLTAGGSAVLETLFGGSEHEMVTLYYVDGDTLAMTHYCMLGNRPH